MIACYRRDKAFECSSFYCGCALSGLRFAGLQVVTQFQFCQFMRDDIPLLAEEGIIPRKPKLPIFETESLPFCR